MKRIGAIICLSMIMVLAMASVAFGAEDALKVKDTYPKDGAKGAAVDNMGVKITFNKEVYDKKNEEKNKELCRLVDNHGNQMPTKVVFSKKDKNVVLVLADSQRRTRAKGNTQYSVTVDKGFKAADGTTLKDNCEVKFTTLNPKDSLKISIGLMIVMGGATVFLAMRETKKAKDPKAQKEAERKARDKAKAKEKDPYKEAKKKGKSVEEVVAAREKKKEKQRVADEKRQERIEARADKREEKQRQKNRKYNLKVERPRSISEAGSTYKDKMTLKDE
jgi:hypothetical protein